MTRSTFVLASLIVSLAACSAPPCPAGSVSVGERCVAADGGVEGDGAVADGATNEDAALGPDACTQLTYYADLDDDDHGDANEALLACTMPAGYVLASDDCDDDAPTTNPSADEICDGIDNDCDDDADESFECVRLTTTTCTTACGTIGSGLCSESCELPSSTTCAVPTESCNGIDDDCDGVIDDDEQVFVREIVTNIPIGQDEYSIASSLAYDDGFAVVAWVLAPPFNPDGWVQFFAASGSPRGTAGQVNMTSDFGDDFASFVHDDHLVIVWATNGNRVFMVRIRISDRVVVTPETLVLTTGTANSEWLNIRAQLVGDDIVFLASSRTGDLLYNTANATSPVLKTGMLPMLDLAGTSARKFEVAVDVDANLLLVVYENVPDGETDHELYVQGFDATTWSARGVAYRLASNDEDDRVRAVTMSGSPSYTTDGLTLNVLSQLGDETRFEVFGVISDSSPTYTSPAIRFDGFYERPSSGTCIQCGLSSLATRGGRSQIATIVGTGLDDNHVIRTAFNAQTGGILSNPSSVADTVASCLGTSCTPTSERNGSVHVTFLSDDRAVFTAAGGERPPRVYLWACPE